MQEQNSDLDRVSHLIGYCHTGRNQAERLFDTLIAHMGYDVDLPEGTIHLSQEEHDEFVARYSAEVEPTLWESKSGKQ